jgi:uncharacterized protein
MKLGSNEDIVDELDVRKVPKGKISRFWVKIVRDGMGALINIPVLVAKGNKPGKVVGITAAVHGNELNGVSVIQRLFKEIDIDQLSGIIVGVPVLNVPSFLRNERRFIDGTDLNHIMPGVPDGNVSEVYAWRIVNKIIRQFDFLLDLHTASNGRVNSHYIRADMDIEIVRKMALLQNAEIIVHNPASDGTLRGTADELGIPAITIELGNPNLFEEGLISNGLIGIYNLLGYFNILKVPVDEHSSDTLICEKSYWMYMDIGGLLEVHPAVNDKVSNGDKIALVRNIFGDVVREYFAPEDGVIIGKSVSPVNQAGGRILHLGILKK